MAAPRGRKDLLLIGNFSDLFGPAWELPPGPGELGDLWLMRNLSGIRLGAAAWEPDVHFLLWFTHKWLIVNFLLIKNLFDKSGAGRLRPGDPSRTYLKETFWEYLWERFLEAGSRKTYLKPYLMKAFKQYKTAREMQFDLLTKALFNVQRCNSSFRRGI